MASFIDFNDTKIPVGKRKQAYVKWAVSKGTSLDTAKRQANKKFGFEKRGKIFVIFQYDTWILGVARYYADVMFQMQATRYEDFKWTTDTRVTDQEIAFYKKNGYEIRYEQLAY